MKRILSFLMITLITACAMTENLAGNISAGKKIAFARNKGNCLACHVIEEGEFAGNIAPKLTALALKFNDKLELRQFIWDATRFNSETSMPPFGRNKILTEDELDKVVDYLWIIE